MINDNKDISLAVLISECRYDVQQLAPAYSIRLDMGQDQSTPAPPPMTHEELLAQLKNPINLAPVTRQSVQNNFSIPDIRDRVFRWLHPREAVALVHATDIRQDARGTLIWVLDRARWRTIVLRCSNVAC